MDKIKVLHLSSEKAWRGGEQQIAYLLEELEGTQVENYVAVRRNTEFEKYCKQKKIQFISLPFRNSFDITSALQIKRICEEKKIRLIHAHSSKSHGIAVISSLLGNGTRIVLSRRVDFIPKHNFLTRWKYNHASVVR